MTLQEFRDILQELKRLKKTEKLKKLDDNMLFDGAVRIYNSISINKPRGREQKERKTDVSAPMTDKQRALLESLDYKGNMNLSKTEATEVIKGLLSSQKSGAM